MRRANPETPAQADPARVMGRPGGFHWPSREGGRECGPFATLRETAQDQDLAAEETLEKGESLAGAEAGISGWTDPDTGEPAEDTVTRLGEH